MPELRPALCPSTNAFALADNCSKRVNNTMLVRLKANPCEAVTVGVLFSEAW